jgi:hypothetical protein
MTTETWHPFTCEYCGAQPASLQEHLTRCRERKAERRRIAGAVLAALMADPNESWTTQSRAGVAGVAAEGENLFVAGDAP